MKRRIGIVGSGAVGKTWLAIAFARTRQPNLKEEDWDDILEEFNTQVLVDGKAIDLTLWDMPGQEEYDALRYNVYPNSDAILIVFSVDQPSSIDYAKKYASEINKYCAGASIVVAATKIDRRKDNDLRRELAAYNQMPLTYDQGAFIAREIGAKYIECSVEKGIGVEETFDLALRESLNSDLEGKQDSTSGRKESFGMSNLVKRIFLSKDK